MSTVIDAVLRLRDQFTPILRHAQDQLQETERVSKRTAKSIKNVGKSIKGIGETLEPLAAGIAIVGAASVKAFGDWEDGCNKVKAKLDRKDWDYMPELSQQAIDLSKSYRQNISAIQEIQEGLASAGLNANQVLQATQGVLNGVDATGAQANVVVSTATNTMMAFGLQADQLNGLMDQMVTTANATDTSMDQMADTFKYASSACNMTHTSVVDLCTMTGELANVGIKGSEAGTGIKDMLTRLQLPEHTKELEAMGVQVHDSEGKFVGMREIIKQLNPLFAQMSDAQKMAMAHDVFGDVASPAALQLISQGVDKFDELHQQIEGSQGAAEAAAEVLNSGLNAQFDILKNNVVAAGIQLAAQFAPEIKEAAQWFGELTQKIQGLSPEQVKMIAIVGGIIVALTGLLVVGGSIIIFFGSLFSSLTAIATAVAAAGGPIAYLAGGFKLFESAILGVGRALMTLFLNPVGLAIAAVLLLAFAVYEIYNNWDGIKAYFAELWESVKAVVMNNVEYLSNCWDNVKTKIVEAWESIKQAIWDKLANLIGEDRLNGIVAKVQKMFDALSARIQATIDYWKDVFNSVVEVVKKVVDQVKTTFEAIVNKIKEVGSKIWAVVKEIFDTVVSIYVSIFSAFIGYVVGYWTMIYTVIMNVVSNIADAVGPAIDTIIDGVCTTFEGLIQFLTGVFSGDWGAAWDGIVQIFQGIFTTISGIAQAELAVVKGIINGIIDSINSINIDIPDWVPGVGGSHFQPSIPKLATGTENWIGGPAMIHDAGPEIVDLPSGTRVIPHSESIQTAREMGRSEGGKRLSITLAKLADSIVVRSEGDIDTLADRLADKLYAKAINQMEGAL